MPELPDPLAGAFQTLYDLVERYGRERTEQQHEMWFQVENAMEELADVGIAEGRRQAAEDRSAHLIDEWSGTLQRVPSRCKTCAAPCLCSCHAPEVGE